MTLMGLHRLEQSGATSPVNVKSVVQRLLTNVDWVNNLGDLGLLLWVCAQIAPEKLGELDRKFQIESALTRFGDAREGITMHLAWFLTGLSYSWLASWNRDTIRAAAHETYQRIIQNQGELGYFGHMHTNRGIKGSMRGRIGSFADQVYPIYALTQFSRAFGDDSALPRAKKSAMAICEAQGPLGQWWWHYDSRSGRVFQQYPVFSVHQDGMAPMALVALSKVSGTSFDPWIYKGLDWIDRRNELSVNMYDESANVIWRCIHQSTFKRYSGALFGDRRNGQAHGPDGLSVLCECRPYELGWLLYGLVDLLDKSAPGAR
jgi:hypothetical protein